MIKKIIIFNIISSGLFTVNSIMSRINTAYIHNKARMNEVTRLWLPDLPDSTYHFEHSDEDKAKLKEMDERFKKREECVKSTYCLVKFNKIKEFKVSLYIAENIEIIKDKIDELIYEDYNDDGFYYWDIEDMKKIDGLIVKIDINTTKNAIQQYFTWKTTQLNKYDDYDTSMYEEIKTKADTLELAYKLNDKRFTEKVIFDFEIDELNKEIREYYICTYLFECFQYKNDVYGSKLQTFINTRPKLARWIWTHIDMNKFLEHINTPNRRMSKMLKIEYDDIPNYIKLIGTTHKSYNPKYKKTEDLGVYMNAYKIKDKFEIAKKHYGICLSYIK